MAIADPNQAKHRASCSKHYKRPKPTSQARPPHFPNLQVWSDQEEDMATLNHDIFRMVLQELSDMSEFAGPLLAAMTSCRSMYRLGIQVLLDRGVVLESEDAVMSFCSFISSSNYAHASLFRSSLVLHSAYFSSKALDALVEVVRRATRLEAISILDLDVILGSAPELAQALVDLPSLKKLEVDARKPTSALQDLLGTLSARLTHAIIDIESSHGHWPANPLLLLENSFETLQELRLGGATMFPSGWDKISLPNLKDLALIDVRLPSPDILAHTLPRLCNLEICDICWDRDELVDVKMAELRRRDNLLRQEKNGSWPKLESVRGPLEDVFALGLTCPVSKLVIEENGQSNAGWDMLRELLVFTPKLEQLELIIMEESFPPAQPTDTHNAAISSTHMRLWETLSGISSLVGESGCKLKRLELDVHLPCARHACDPFSPTTDIHGVMHPRCPISDGIWRYEVVSDAEKFFRDTPTLSDVRLRLRHHDDAIAVWDCMPLDQVVHIGGLVPTPAEIGEYDL
ncbi:hypothetical protein L227DRAFT_653149 [Lentinus tigrinus ALCF2SS1-6]|uniref:F-box domain-containing protein n=1 Tax=Lentinus tigrinus ALCF2SS1-6 TaxID=1328759 RepID=A0A5C2SAW7_9APHY|nr:hypothetical protein L227DRAFT_653149 [Lentinus tigrinus ALCF2SS1-6]